MANGIIKGKKVTAGAIEQIAGLLANSGNEISTGLISYNAKTNDATYSKTYRTIMQKLSLYEKDRNKRISNMDIGTTKNINSLQKEMDATKKAVDLKIQMYQQEMLAKQAIVDAQANAEIAAVQAKIDAIDKAKEQEARDEATKEYEQSLNEKYSALAVADEKDKAGILEDIEKLKEQRKKELLDQQREDQKTALQDEIEKIRQSAEDKKELYQQEYDQKAFMLQQQYDKEVELMQQLMTALQKDKEQRAELDKIEADIKAKQTELTTGHMSKEEKKRTQNELTELKAREGKLVESLATNKKNIAGFTTDLKTISDQYGDALLMGMKSTEADIQEYLAQLASDANRTIAGIISAASSASATVASMKSSSSSKTTSKKSHLSGLDYVPFDGYEAILHRGERVLTQQENNAYSNNLSNKGDTFIFNSPKAIDAAESARLLRKTKQEMALGFN
jgi:myosin heavy subunit